MQLSREDVQRGRRNFEQSAGGLHRREFLCASAAVPALGAAYFGYKKIEGSPVRAAIVGTGNEGCAAMIEQSPTDYLEYVGFFDIRP